MGATVLQRALNDAGLHAVDRPPDALYVSNLLADELQNQKHIAPLIASEVGLHGIEALSVRAAMASGSAALRAAVLAVLSGEARTAVALGVEKMSDGDATPALAKALDAEFETPRGDNMITANAGLMKLYLERYGVPHSVFANFPLNAHNNALNNPDALFQKEVSREQIESSRIVQDPMRLMDCAPICDGAAAVVLSSEKPDGDRPAVKILASSVATDLLRVDQREDPLGLRASRISAERAYTAAGLKPADIDFFEVHDAFSIMTCLSLEACGFAERGHGWRLAEDGAIFPGGKLPLSTFGGLKARGHPIGATALYQATEILQQLQGRAGKNQVPNAKVGMMQSIGGAGTTLITHIFGV